ncbi:hypothetical protein QEN19_001930 [Hanseniaspora menglaensis]
MSANTSIISLYQATRDTLLVDEKQKVFINNGSKKRFRESVSTAFSNSSSKKLSVSPSLSSMLHQRKSQKLNSSSKKPTYHYHKYNKNSFESKTIIVEDLEKVNTVQRRRSSNYWFNTNINNNNITGVFSDFLDAECLDPLTMDDGVIVDKNKIDNTNVSTYKQNTFSVIIFNNLDDLDLTSDYGIADIKEFYTPIFDIKAHRNINKKQYHSRISPDIELASIGTNEKCTVSKSAKPELQLLNEAVTTSPFLPSSNKEIMQPHFMRLYAVVQNSQYNGVLPHLDIDDHLLAKLSYDDIWSLDVPGLGSIGENKFVTEDLKIKLALLSRKKLWCDMIVQVTKKQEPLNNRCDSISQCSNSIKKITDNNVMESKNKQLLALNQHQFAHIGYEKKDVTERDVKSTSLLRLKNGPIPWNPAVRNGLLGSNKNGANQAHTTVIKPYGVLANSKQTQYVVKGWVDKRFF